MGRLFSFLGGVKPAPHKDESTRSPIAAAPLPSRLIVPLRQSVGGTPHPLVGVGQRVRKGERIGAPDGNFSAAVHAPTSGTVRAIEAHLMPHPSGLSAPCIVIEPDGAERWIERQPLDYRAAAPDEVRDYLRDAGIVGLGGATFPSHIKLRPGQAGSIDALIINGAECEPWITCDDMLMRERAAAVVAGVAVIRHVAAARRVLIGIEDNKPQAIAAMREAVGAHGDAAIRVVPVPTRYPAGGEKQLIKVLTGIEIPYGKFGAEYGVQCFNVGTAYSIHRAVAFGEPLISRLLTLTGNVARPGNFEVLIGTPIDELLGLAGPLPDTDRYIMGGPMMGFSLPDLHVPVVKATNCIIAASPRLFPPAAPELPCIRCGACARACPVELQPQELYWFSRARNFGKAEEYHIFDCIECGCCAFVCPSHIRLVDYFRFAKTSMRAREREKAASDAARSRFEFRNFRTEREQQEKAERLARKAAAARAAAAAPAAQAPGAAAAPTPAAEDPKKALIAAAFERARAQKEKVKPKNIENLPLEKQAEIAEIEARRNQLHEMAKTPPEEPV